jgi:hypothetical protein
MPRVFRLQRQIGIGGLRRADFARQRRRNLRPRHRQLRILRQRHRQQFGAIPLVMVATSVSRRAANSSALCAGASGAAW